MAFFKFRKNAGDAPAPSTAAAPATSVEALRRRAKHRLIGAALLVLIGVVGFPLLFDNQPRPIAVDIPIEIPDKNKVKPLVVPSPAATAPAPAVAVAPVAAPPVVAAPVVVPPAPAAVPKPAPAPVVPAAQKPPATPKPNPVAKPAEETSQTAAAADGRFVVQVGAFADAAKAREVRLKVEKAGLKTYTQVVETKDGRRIRVRVGPFAARPEAEQAAEKIKKISLPADVLTL